ncbi:hypothetical protein HP15_p187g168 (plasmid) [Marinobacter adhaerens HP15]|uniref:Uncharacterized protein n=1 Tax=Marinobacter adhaerens (strain DSM 23420 / HP15) TaxID=225937 RepID=E4PSD0_MARAH|nr:hypothetical protein HP15_p187g168 [Marinobacter adhaerens HP15]
MLLPNSDDVLFLEVSPPSANIDLCEQYSTSEGVAQW